MVRLNVAERLCLSIRARACSFIPLLSSSPYSRIALPTIQSVFSIPITKNGSNHTPQFAQSASTPEAHAAAINTSKALAATALRVLTDETFYNKVSLDLWTTRSASH